VQGLLVFLILAVVCFGIAAFRPAKPDIEFRDLDFMFSVLMIGS
jgi:hypothetical protein